MDATSVKPIRWSYSSMRDFQGCPRRYYEVKVLENFPFVDTPQTIYGKQVHSAIEDYLKDGVCLPDEYDKFRPTIEKVARIDGTRYVEERMAVTRDGDPCSFSDEAGWVRGIADLAIVAHNKRQAIIIDWKTGSARYPDAKQLELMFLLLRAKMPDIEQFNCFLFFLAHGKRINVTFRQEDTNLAWGYWEREYEKLEAAFVNSHFPPKPTVLCGWCPVITCKHNPKAER